MSYQIDFDKSGFERGRFATCTKITGSRGVRGVLDNKGWGFRPFLCAVEFKSF